VISIERAAKKAAEDAAVELKKAEHKAAVFQESSNAEAAKKAEEALAAAKKAAAEAEAAAKKEENEVPWGFAWSAACYPIGVLKVKGFRHGSAIHAWNAQQLALQRPELCVQPGDTVKSVNGKRGHRDIERELRLRSTCSFVLQAAGTRHRVGAMPGLMSAEEYEVHQGRLQAVQGQASPPKPCTGALTRPHTSLGLRAVTGVVTRHRVVSRGAPEIVSLSKGKTLVLDADAENTVPCGASW